MEITKNLKNGGDIAVALSFKLIGACGLLMILLTVGALWQRIHLVRNAVDEAVCAVAASNVHHFYGGAREGSGYAHKANSEYSFDYTISTAAVSNELVKSFGDDVNAENNGATIKKPGKFTVKNLDVKPANASDTALNFTTSFTLNLEFRLFKNTYDIISLKQEVKSAYEAKFN